MGKYFLASIVFVVTAAQAAPMYKWVDENGVTHFSEQPPASQPAAQSINVRAIPSISGENPQRDTASQQPASGQSRLPTLPEPTGTPEKDPAACAEARDYIAKINQSPRVRATDPQTGELRYLTEEERTEQMESWQKRAETYCE